MSETLLKLTIGNFPPWSSRGCTQTLEPINNQKMHRTVNNELIVTSGKRPQKFKTLIKCTDKIPIAMDGQWKGQDVTVSCIQSLWRNVSGESVDLDRDVVQGSVIVFREDNSTVDGLTIEGRKVIFPEDIPKGFIKYRPVLKMKLVDFSYEVSEWQNQQSWSIALEEV